MNRAIIVFANPGNAAQSVAGLPAAARAVHEVAQAGIEQCWIAAGPGWRPDAVSVAEMDRLANGMELRLLNDGRLPAPLTDDHALLISGEELPRSEAIRLARSGLTGTPAGVGILSPGEEPAFAANGHAHAAAALLKDAARRIVVETGKPTDGIVSRTINRPVSRSITRSLLHLPWIRPIHATLVTSALALAMFLFLVTGEESGLVIGALLFQAASIFDGVDGEIARATFRTSDRGAMADSLIDAATNVAFIAGVVINLWIQGNRTAAYAGAAGVAAMALGLFMLGLRTRGTGQQLTFNELKDRFRERPSAVKRWLTWLTMRDFYALAGVAFVVTGFAHVGLVMFAVIATGWLAVVLTLAMRKA